MTDDYGKTWTKLTDGHNGIAADEPTRVVREDPDRQGLLYAGTEFGMYVSFNNGGTWQSFQMNLPVVAVTDIKIAHKDLVLSTQGRGFWILDNLTVLQQLKPGAQNALYVPRVAVRVPASGDAGRRGEGAQYPLMGAQIDYSLASDSTGPVTMDILDKSGKVVRSFTSVAPPARPARAGQEDDASGGDEEEGGFRPTWPTVLETKAGMHRFTWDLRYTGGSAAEGRPAMGNGPVAVPGDYQVRVKAGEWSATQPLHVIEDPRVTKDGVTTADLQEQFDHNERVLALVNDTNRLVARLRDAEKEIKASHAESSEKGKKLQALSDKVLTPPIRYSQPGLQAHVQYLYGMTNRTDQKIGKDAVERYQYLRKKIDEAVAELDSALKM